MAGVKRPMAAVVAPDAASPQPSPGPPSPALSARRSPWGSPRGPPAGESPRATAPTPAMAPSPSPHDVREIPSFAPEATVALVGVRGAGKSTLAVMAASALKRRIIDMETAFQRATESSSAAFRQAHGAAECQAAQARVLDDVLRQNPSGAIVVCSWMERRVQTLLGRLAATNPVVHVLRSLDAIRDHVRIADRAKARSLLAMSSLFFRSCTNLEFFNVSDAPAPDRLDDAPAPAPYLALKRAERHLLKFLSLVYPAGTIPFFESASPLASVPLEQRRFTYALSVDLGSVLGGRCEWHDSVVGVDAVQIFVDSLVAAQHEHEARPPADLFTAVADGVTEAVAVVRRNTMLPVLLHIKLPERPAAELLRAYLDLVAHALRLAPEMLTIDLRLDGLDIAQVMSAKRRSKLVGSYLAPTDAQPWGSPSWLAWYDKACQLGCDMVRLVRPAAAADDDDDNLGVAQLRRRVASRGRIPLIAYNSGPLGRHSACMNPILSLVAARPVAETDARPAPYPYLTAREATGALFASFVRDAMRLYVLGTNVGYSMSPAMYNAALAACGIPHRYEACSTPSLAAVRHLLHDARFGGASLLLPFKVEAMALTHALSPHARAIGAVNTLIPVRRLNPDGSLPAAADLLAAAGRAGPVRALYGDNTDWIGIRACIQRGLSPANAVRPATCGLVVGAGGMARAAVYAMLQIGVANVVVYNRTRANADSMVAHFRCLLAAGHLAAPPARPAARFHVVAALDDPWPPDYRLPSIVISCIPTHPVAAAAAAAGAGAGAGTAGGDAPAPSPAPDFRLPPAWLRHRTGGVICELGYKTLDTPLLAQARAAAPRGWVAMDGLDLLPEQGFAQFELFTGRRAPRRVMRREVLERYVDEQGTSRADELRRRLLSIAEQES